jgi:hypothetical protein
MRLCYLFLMCHVDHYALFTYFVYELIVIGEMAMELLSGISYYHIRNSIMIELSMLRYVSSKLVGEDAHI